MAAGDIQNFQLTDDNGVIQAPPNAVAVTVRGLVAGDRLGVFELDAPFAGLWLKVPAAVMARRIETRGADASDADRAVLESQLAVDIGPLDWTRITAVNGTRETLAVAVAALSSNFDTDEGA